MRPDRQLGREDSSDKINGGHKKESLEADKGEYSEYEWSSWYTDKAFLKMMIIVGGALV